MEAWLLLVIFTASVFVSFYGFFKKNVWFAFFGSLLLLTSGAILYVDGYDSQTICSDSSDLTNCHQATNFVYDVNNNVVRADLNVLKMNASNSVFSKNAGTGFVVLGLIGLMLSAIAYGRSS